MNAFLRSSETYLANFGRASRVASSEINSRDARMVALSKAQERLAKGLPEEDSNALMNTFVSRTTRLTFIG